MIINFVIGLTIYAVITTIIMGVMACRLYTVDVEVKAMKKSTHKIQWMPIDQNWAQSEKEVNTAFEQDQGHPDDLRGL